MLKIDGLKRINKANNEIVIIRGSTCTAGDLSSQCRSKSKSKLSVSFKDNSKSELGNRDLSNLGKTAKLDSVNAVETKLGSGSKSVLGNSDNLDLGDVNKSDLGGANNSRLRITAESDFGSPVKLKFESKAKTDLGNANNSNFENGIKSDLGSVAKSEYRSLFSIRTAQSHYMDAIEDSGYDLLLDGISLRVCSYNLHLSGMTNRIPTKMNKFTATKMLVKRKAKAADLN